MIKIVYKNISKKGESNKIFKQFKKKFKALLVIVFKSIIKIIILIKFKTKYNTSLKNVTKMRLTQKSMLASTLNLGLFSSNFLTRPQKFKTYIINNF